ncbi:MAG: hypothetical protein P4L49_09945 [Desulfosporosinus sp.]|nr:hypothetical protein [Desulfosporosinus sp.]
MENHVCLGSLLVCWSGGDSSIISQSVTTADNAYQTLLVNNQLRLRLTNISSDKTLIFAFPEGGVLPDIEDTTAHANYARIYFYFPVGNGEEAFLTQQQAETIVCTTSPGWEVRQVLDIGRHGVYWALIPQDEVALAPEDSAAVQFDQLACSGELERMSLLTILAKDIDTDEQDEGPNSSLQNALGYLPVLKKFSSPHVRRFTCKRGSAGILDTVKLEWEALGLLSDCRFLPSADEEEGKSVPQQGELDYALTESISFALQMTQGAGDIYREYCSVLVEEPQIITYKADKNNVKYGETVKLSYTLQNTFHVYLNQGIGRLECSPQDNTGLNAGEVIVTPILKETTYTLTCLGREKLLSNRVIIIIEDYLTIDYLSYYRIPLDSSYHYYLKWKVDNCTQISLTVQGQGELSGGQTEGSTSFADVSAAALLLHVACQGPGKQAYSSEISPD